MKTKPQNINKKFNLVSAFYKFDVCRVYRNIIKNINKLWDVDF